MAILAAERKFRGVVTVEPLTSVTDHAHSPEVLLPADRTGMKQDSKIQADQVRAASLQHIGSLVGERACGMTGWHLNCDDGRRANTEP